MLTDVFDIRVSVPELALRGTLIYWLRFGVFRFLLRRNLRREFITMEELYEELREQGIIKIADVKRAYLEGDDSGGKGSDKRVIGGGSG